jgi:hypothetical protein
VITLENVRIGYKEMFEYTKDIGSNFLDYFIKGKTNYLGIKEFFLNNYKYRIILFIIAGSSLMEIQTIISMEMMILTRSIERSYDEEDTTNDVENDGNTIEAFLTGRYCPEIAGENDPVCSACEELEESYKELCLIDPCLVAREVDRGQCYRLIAELLKR